MNDSEWAVRIMRGRESVVFSGLEGDAKRVGNEDEEGGEAMGFLESGMNLEGDMSR